MSPDKRSKDNSLIRISDVLRTSDRMRTEGDGVLGCRIDGVDIAICSIPAGSQGGDFYGVVYLEQCCISLFVGDIAGHDFSAGILATAALEFIGENHDSLIHPNLFLRSMGRSFYRQLSSVGRFLTMAVCTINSAANTISYSSVGHPPALLLRADGSGPEELAVKAMPLGFDREVSVALIQRDFMPGDRLMIYTDGISGARSVEKEEFGIPRLEKLLRTKPGSFSSDFNADAINPAADVVRATIRDLLAFTQNGPEVDDRTVLCAFRGSSFA